MTPRLKEIFLKEIQPSLKEKFGLKNLYMGPKINKIVIPSGLVGLKIWRSIPEHMLAHSTSRVLTSRNV